MKILGLSGAFGKKEKDFLPEVPVWFFHDSTAALLIDGEERYVVEEERLNREKHTTKFAVHAIQNCLYRARLSFSEIDIIAYSSLESFVTQSLYEQYLRFPNLRIKSCREFFVELFREYFDPNFDGSKLVFVQHHLAHAYVAYFDSGFDASLVCVIDGQGEKESFSLYDVCNGKFHLLKAFSNLHSLGNLYVESIKLLAYYFFDEYKVMGLAPYGNPATYRCLFSKLYELLPKGEFELKRNKMTTLLESGFPPRRKGEPFHQNHKDFAAALQEMLETIVLHVLKYWQQKTNHTHLCMAGGVAHNCTLNGLLAYSGLFKNIFVHPASNDSGAALGAAMYVAQQKKEPLLSRRIFDVYWGPDLGSKEAVANELTQWSPLISYKNVDDIASVGASLIAQGHVIGWVQGNMEFGPRALGNRSILADPRPKENKDRINVMVKKREGYRPFAPSVLDERVYDYFEIPPCDLNLDFMVFNLRVKKKAQALLGATTHINGTARIQMVRKERNHRYWNVIKEFEKLTGVAVLLNTSFNNMAEPIIATVCDAINCFLTTGLDYLIIDDFLISKTSKLQQQLTICYPSMVSSAVLRSEKTAYSTERYEVYFPHRPNFPKQISPEVYAFLKQTTEGGRSLCPFPISKEIYDLWSERYIFMHPPQKPHFELGSPAKHKQTNFV